MGKPNIVLSIEPTSRPFAPVGGGGDAKRAKRSVAEHAAKLSAELAHAAAEDKAAEARGGSYLTFTSAEGFDLEVDSLENKPGKIVVLNSSRDEKSGVMTATVFVPTKKSEFFSDRVAQYGDPAQKTKKGKPKNEKLVESIEAVKKASVRDLWDGPADEFPGALPKWCELWLDVFAVEYAELNLRLERACHEIGITLSKEELVFPEVAVRMLRADGSGLQRLFDDVGYIESIRPCGIPVSEITNLDARSQREFVNDMADRLSTELGDTSVCVLDSEVNRAHPLLAPVVDDESVLSADPAWSGLDVNGHGTEMAGVAAHGDLRRHFESRDGFLARHAVESVEILPPKGENEEHLYGAITHDAVYVAEIERPARRRAFCMAVTEGKEHEDGRPSAWSAEIDSLASGAGEDDDGKRLFLISAGNIQPSEFRNMDSYAECNMMYSVQSPAEAWNALTVGAYVGDDARIVERGAEGWHAAVEPGSLAPHSRTSVLWDGSWPIKPEICLVGGNVAADGFGNHMDVDDLGVLTTSKDIPRFYFDALHATSAATGSASWMAAEVMRANPSLWPETVRALLVHSARWTDQMKKDFLPDGDSTKTGRRNLLRSCGWGVPSLERALESLDNRVNLIVQREMTPFTEDGKLNEMHLYELPWPQEELLKLADKQAELRVTLSYFVEPNPSTRGRSTKFQYQSLGLRFQVNGSTQTADDLLRSVNKKARDEAGGDNGGNNGSVDWYLGQQMRDVGSIHSDFKVMSAAELANARYIAVYPVGGWWSHRLALRKAGCTVRYSLVVSIETPGVEADLYTEIVSKIPVSIATPVPGLA